MYRHLNESYIQWLESRGRSPFLARISASFSFAFAALMNSASICFLLQEVRGPRVIDWIGSHLWTVWVWAGVCVLAHALLSLRIPSSHPGTATEATRIGWN